MSFWEFLQSIPAAIFAPDSWVVWSAILGALSIMATIAAVIWTALIRSWWVAAPLMLVEVAAGGLLVLFFFWSGVIA